MEKITNETEVMETAIPEPQSEFTIGKSTRKPLREWGFEVAGLNRGEATALESHLRWIQQGHIVDETYNADDEQNRKNRTAEEISILVSLN
jgi:hypothetical protein